MQITCLLQHVQNLFLLRVETQKPCGEASLQLWCSLPEDLPATENVDVFKKQSQDLPF